MLLLLAAAGVLTGGAAAASITYRLLKGLPPVELPSLPKIRMPNWAKRKPKPNELQKRTWPGMKG